MDQVNRWLDWIGLARRDTGRATEAPAFTLRQSGYHSPLPWLLSLFDAICPIIGYGGDRDVRWVGRQVRDLILGRLKGDIARCGKPSGYS